jgi:hypothetical protein
MDMEKDAIFELAERYVTCTGKSVFLTGKAGTGKTTFLKHITRTTSKRFVVLAPTGVAAINAGGSTIHSFFQLPLCPYLPDVKELITEYQTPERYRSLRKERVNIIRTLDLLIIDEISMVRADLIDAVDMTLRRYRRNDKPFGGVQLLMIGDAQQLSPVVKENERPYMSQVYPSPYFFHAKALQKMDYVTIELQKVYRQKDREFLDILNAVRENRITSEILRKLNTRVHAYDEEDEPIRLTSHNAKADSVNLMKLDQLPGEPYSFEAETEGEFPENSYPADFVLTLKVGAQVMFIRNDPEGEYYNGKIGKVESIDSRGLIQVTDEDSGLINVTPVEWENIQYVLDEESGEIVPSVLGKFRQFPLRVAWAITIHKSQGLTFDRVTIDAGAAFAFGQVYVALSRCRTLEGISLDTPISYSAICSDMHVSDFNARIPEIQSVESALENEERTYLFDTLRNIFDLDDVSKTLGWFRKTWVGSLENIYTSEYQTLLEWQNRLRDIGRTAETFQKQLSRIEAARMEDDSYLKERLLKASEYFLPVFEQLRNFSLACSDLEIDNKETKKRVKEASDELLTLLDIGCSTLQMIQKDGFSIDSYNRIRTECMLEDRKKTRKGRLRKLDHKPGEAGIVNEELRERLQEWRSARFKQDNVPAYTIMHQSTLMEIATFIPKTKKELLAIKGFGEARFQKYGEEILKITADYSSSV